ncbi:MAG: sulfatase-like hydrolase/transferase, partial [bacterium]
MLRRVWVVLLFICSISATGVAIAAEKPTSPNVVFILADDLGYGDLACYGRKDIATPNLDRLAEQGVRFRAHYANGAECTPTRT